MAVQPEGATHGQERVCFAVARNWTPVRPHAFVEVKDQYLVRMNWLPEQDSNLRPFD